MEGDHILVVTATDAAGNIASQTVHSTLAAAVPAYSIARINPSGGNWSNPANWDTGRVPGNNDDVLISVTNKDNYYL